MFGFLQRAEAEICSQGSNLQCMKTEMGLKNCSIFNTEGGKNTHGDYSFARSVQQKYNLNYLLNIAGVVYSLVEENTLLSSCTLITEHIRHI